MAAGIASATAITVAVGVVAWAMFAFWLHRVLIGVSPFWDDGFARLTVSGHDLVLLIYELLAPVFIGLEIYLMLKKR